MPYSGFAVNIHEMAVENPKRGAHLSQRIGGLHGLNSLKDVANYLLHAE